MLEQATLDWHKQKRRIDKDPSLNRWNDVELLFILEKKQIINPSYR